VPNQPLAHVTADRGAKAPGQRTARRPLLTRYRKFEVARAQRKWRRENATKAIVQKRGSHELRTDRRSNDQSDSIASGFDYTCDYCDSYSATV